jgi:hypothetical protein
MHVQRRGWRDALVEDRLVAADRADRVERVGEDRDPASPDRRASDASQQLLGLAGKHRSGDHLDPPMSLGHRSIMGHG